MVMNTGGERKTAFRLSSRNNPFRRTDTAMPNRDMTTRVFEGREGDFSAVVCELWEVSESRTRVTARLFVGAVCV